MHKIQKYGWKPDLPDARDFYFRVARPKLEALPPKVDLSTNCPPVYNQGELGSCTANAIGAAHQFEQMKSATTVPAFQPSRLFIYWNERRMEGTINEDSGAFIRDGMKSVAKEGVCPEEQWPYDIQQFRTRPPEPCYKEALGHQVVQYLRVDQTLEQLKGCLAAGYPVVFGFTVYSGFESATVAQTGELNMPGPDESVMGGHAVLLVGYDDETQRWLVRNSWGADWGKSGYFTMPYAYLTNSDLSADFWTIRMIEIEDTHVTPEPPKPEPHRRTLCDLFLPAAKSFVDSAILHTDTARKMGIPQIPTERMVEAGLRGLQQYLDKVLAVRTKRG